MLIYTTPEKLIVEEKGNRIYFCRKTGTISTPTNDLDVLDEDFTLCGEVEFLIGNLLIEGIVYLFFVAESSIAAHYRGTKENTEHAIKRIERVVAISVKSDVSLIRSLINPPTTKIKQNTGKLLKFFSDKISKESRPAILDDVLKLFNESKDFYFCRERDVTISAQKFFSKRSNTSEESFFWNRYMLETLIETLKDGYLNWTCPIMQGFVSTTKLEITDQISAYLKITIISRRSTHRAGARYLRRGIDENSNVANFVETELILNIFEHELSYVQIRGSIPCFWSQRGFKYRPPLVINRGVEETHPYFEEHIKRLKHHYGKPIVSVSLVDQKGRELPLAQRYLEHCIKLSDPEFSVVSFDLHHHCRGLNFQKLQTLICGMEDLLKNIGFCWVDKTGEVVQRQNGVVRVNCIDCLDRTNLVQGQISLHVVLQQAQRLGIFGPLCEPPEALVQTLQILWADNGDVLSTQYAGTAALKGDVTRSGERKLAGIMKDGYNSASRYYLTHTRDAARQRAINLVTRQSESAEMVAEGEEFEDEKEEEENICRMVTETIQFLVPTKQTVIAGWGLINAISGSDEIDTVVVLTRNKLYVATYEIDGEKMQDVRIVSLDDIRCIEIGMVNSKQCCRIVVLEDQFIWKPAQVRLFNNAAIRLKTQEEANEYMLSVAEQINVGRNMVTGEGGSVQIVPRIPIPQVPVHRKSLAAMGALITKIKNVKKNTSSPNLNKVDTGQLITIDGGDENESDVSESSKTDDLVSKLLKNTFKKAEEPDPFASLLPLIQMCQTKISLL